MTAACYSCPHRRNVPGDAHSRCAHPLIADHEMEAAILMLYRGEFRVGPALVQFAPHGIANNWAYWPISFDPVWLLSCNLREISAPPNPSPPLQLPPETRPDA